MKVNSLKRNDPNYPEILANIPDPPKHFFYCGAEPGEWLDKPKVSIVGSRKITTYGREITEKLVSGLVDYGVVIVSGLALGIDSIAHQSALEAGGITVAVMPGGLDRIYPSSHSSLARRIVDHGGSLVSEHPVGTPIYKYSFIARNRIISGLADILIITEAAADSGSLHTASFALEQGRTVMAVPGNINSPQSTGANNLIKSGALPLTALDDVLFSLGISPKSRQKRVFRGTKHEQAVLRLITDGVANQENLALRLGLDAAELGFIITTLEINGHIRSGGAGNWHLA